MAVAKEKANPKGKEKEQGPHVVVRMVRETRSELRKVVWPSREETLRLTAVVIIVSVVIGAFLFFGDSIFLSLYSLLINVVQQT